MKLWEPIAKLYTAYPGRLIMMLSIAFLGSMGGNAAGFLFPKFLQETHHWSPANVSSLFFWRRDSRILGSIVAGRLSDRYGRRVMGAAFLFLSPLLTIWMYTALGMVNRARVDPRNIFRYRSQHDPQRLQRGIVSQPRIVRPPAARWLVAGTTGGALGLFLEGVLYNLTGSLSQAVCYLTVFWMSRAGDPVVPSGDVGTRARGNLARSERALISCDSSTR